MCQKGVYTYHLPYSVHQVHFLPRRTASAVRSAGSDSGANLHRMTPLLGRPQGPTLQPLISRFPWHANQQTCQHKPRGYKGR